MKLAHISKHWIRYLLGPLLFVFLVGVIWNELASKQQLPLLWEGLQTACTSGRTIYLLIVIGLMPLNWLLEAYKWQVAVQAIQPVSLFTAFRATLSGISFSMLLPNRVGEYVGRILYLPPSKRVNAIAVTVVASMSQLLWTLFLGLIGGCVLFSSLQTNVSLFTLLLLVIAISVCILFVLLLLCFFRVSALAHFLSSLFKSERLQKWLLAPSQFTSPILLQLLLLSFFRYLIFIVQYGAALYLFSVLLNPFQILATVSLCFLILAVVPTFAIAELGLRGVVSIWVIGLFSANSAGILLAAFSLWVINLVVPASVGALLLLGVQKFWNHA